MEIGISEPGNQQEPAIQLVAFLAAWPLLSHAKTPNMSSAPTPSPSLRSSRSSSSSWPSNQGGRAEGRVLPQMRASSFRTAPWSFTSTGLVPRSLCHKKLDDLPQMPTVSSTVPIISQCSWAVWDLGSGNHPAKPGQRTIP